MTERRVVVTGIGTINPLGNNIEEYFSNLEKGVSGAAPITHFDAEKFKTKFACEVKNYDSNLYFDRKEVRKYDLFTQYALIAATQAVEDSALDLEAVDKEQVGVIWSSGIGGIKSFFDECLGWAAGDGTPRFSPFFIPRMISDIAAGFISMKYGFMGPNYCTVSACASSNHGMIAAFDAIRYGKADVMVAGGSEAAVNEPSVGGFNSMQALSTRNDDPQHASRPFDKDRDGFVIGEGAGALIFEEYEHAKARGAKIYCELAGYGARRIALGTVLVTEPGFAEVAAQGFGELLVADIAARDGQVKVNGWRDGAGVALDDAVAQLTELGFKHLVYTDIARDGMQTGIDVAAYRHVAEVAGFPVVASGGISTLDDIRALAAVGEGAIEGAITGRALYEGNFTLVQALAAARGEE